MGRMGPYGRWQPGLGSRYCRDVVSLTVLSAIPLLPHDSKQRSALGQADQMDDCLQECGSCD